MELNKKEEIFITLSVTILSIIICGGTLVKIAKGQENKIIQSGFNFIIEDRNNEYRINEYTFINSNCIKIIDTRKIICGSFEITPLNNSKPNKNNEKNEL